MIIPDSDRALKRLWYAKKKLSVIKMHDLPAKATLYEGFTMKVWQQGELEGGFIKSPMGLVVLCVNGEQEHPDTDPDVISGRYNAYVADFWMGAVNYKNPIHCMITDPPAQGVAVGRLVNGDISELYEIQNFKVVPSYYYRISGPFGDFNPITVYRDMWSAPKVMPYLGELFWCGNTGMQWYDADQNGYFEEIHYITEILLNFYNSNGTQTTRTCCFHEVGQNLANPYPSRIYPGMPKLEITEQELIDGELVDVYKEFMRYGHMHTVDYDRTPGDDAIIGSWFEASHKEIRNSEWLVSTIIQGVPSATLRGLMNDHARPHGNYQFAIGHTGKVQQVHCMNCWYDPVPTAGVITELVSFFGSNPSYIGYAYAIYKWSDGGSIYHWTFTDILPLLESLADNPIETSPGNYDMQVVHYMMGQLFCFPNDNWTCAFDSAMFHSHAGNVFTWSRHYGAVRIANSGITATTLYLPTTVTANNGVRPDIAYAGNERYTLVATKPGKLTEPITDSDWIGVKGVFIGTPFLSNSWRELPSPPAGFRLRYVRPVNLSVNEISGEPTSAAFVGIAEQYDLIGAQTELPTYVFRACFINYYYNEETGLWEGEWQIMSPVPVEDIDWQAQFDLCFFGIGSLADDMRNHPDPPNICPTMPAQTYDNYIAAGFP